MRFAIRGVWAPPAARETFSEAEREECVADYEENGPQYVGAAVPSAQPAGFAFYEYPDGRTLVVVVRDGLASLMTKEELAAAQEGR